MAYEIDLKGKNALIFGVANHRSIAWAIASELKSSGANIALAYQNERLKKHVNKLTENDPSIILTECDVTQEDQIENAIKEVNKKIGDIDIIIHSIAFAPKEELSGNFSNTTRNGFLLSLEISAFSLIAISKAAKPFMKKPGSSIITLSFQASEKVYPGYNVMGTAKAALEHSVRQLAFEFGEQGVRVNAISAGPLQTLAARGISGFRDMHRNAAEKAPMKRNITMDEVSQTALFLCSGLSSGITGAIIPVDAGYHIMAV